MEKLKNDKFIVKESSFDFLNYEEINFTQEMNREKFKCFANVFELWSEAYTGKYPYI